jgi:uncharacterized repeat protein (TIGR01451 family)
VSPGATGKVTFYDSAVILGVGTVTGNRAILTTPLLTSGVHTLRAYYSGDANFAPSESAPLTQTVRSQPGTSFEPGLVSGISFDPELANRFGPGIVADFNGDGKPDLALIGSPFETASAFSIYLGKGDGTFRLVASYSGALMATGDFNRDGIVDLIVFIPSSVGCSSGNCAVSPGTPSVTVFLGNGDGTFLQAGSYLAGVSNLDEVGVADFNNDGKADLVIGYLGAGESFLLLGNGDGTFRAPVSTGAPETVGPPIAISVADFNLDGNADFYGDMVHLGNGDGTFQPPLTAVGFSQIADLNGDGIPDLFSVLGSFLNVELGNGDGTFRAAVSSQGPSGQPSVQAPTGDFNGDGAPDLITFTTTGAWLSLGNGDGTFQPAMNLTALSASGGIAGDFNGDGRTDFILFGINGISVTFLGAAVPDLTIALTSTGSFSPGAAASFTITAGNVGSGPTTGLVTVSDSLPAGVTPISMSGSGWTCSLPDRACTRSDSLAAGATYPPVFLAVLVVGNLTGTIEDMATVSGGGEINTANDSAGVTITVLSASVTLASSPNPAILGQPVTLTATVPPGSIGRIAFYDGVASLGESTAVNGHGSLTTRLLSGGNHLLQARFEPNSSSPYGPGASSILVETVDEVSANGFQSVVDLATPDLALYVAEGDFNGDGIVDLAYAGNTSLGVLLGRGDGTFGAPIVTHFQGFIGLSGSLTVGDFNGDGKSDLLVSVNSAAYLALGNGDGTFQPATLIADTMGNAVVTDLNRDGKLDIAFVGSTAGRTLTVLLGNGDGTFGAPLNTTLSESVGYCCSYYVLTIVASDFNGDGKVDLALPVSTAESQIMVLLGNGDGTFQTTPLLSSPSIYPYILDSLAVADFNLDGKPDLAINYFGQTQATVLLGNGNGTFQPSVISYPGTIAGVGDVNGDGKPDLITRTRRQ